MIIMENSVFYEMATIKRDMQNNKCITVNPDSTKEGNPYFKYYNHQSHNSATAVIRILFKEPGFVIHKNFDGKEFWNLSNADKKILMKNLMSPYSANKNYTIWDYAKFQWNYEYLEVDIDFEDYVNGEYDELYKDNPSYVSSTEQIKNYNQPLYLVGKGDIKKYMINNAYININDKEYAVGVVLGPEGEPNSPFASEIVTVTEYEKGLKNKIYGPCFINNLTYYTVCHKNKDNVYEMKQKWLDELVKLGVDTNSFEYNII